MKKYFFFILFSILFSCKEDGQEINNNKNRPLKGVIQKHKLTVFLENDVKQKIIDWKEYTNVEKKITNFYTISANEAINNALDLAELVKLLREKTMPKELNNPSFKTRINVLNTEVLRLKDMSYIEKALSSKEIHFQVEKILEAFAATNSKINAVYTKLQIDKEIEIKNEKK